MDKNENARPGGEPEPGVGAAGDDQRTGFCGHDAENARGERI